MGCTSSAPEIKAAPSANDSNDIAKKNSIDRETTAGTESTVGCSNRNRNNDGDDVDYASGFKDATPTTAIKVGNLSIRYAALCRRGRDPDHPAKPNQDCYGCHHGEEFWGRGGPDGAEKNDGHDGADKDNPNDNDNPKSDSAHDAAFFVVYDGHGPHGERCSHFVRTRLPALLKANIGQAEERKRFINRNAGKEDSSPLSADDVHESLHEAHVDCNAELRRSKIDDSHSGTTSVGAYLHGDGRVTICNVGDSRVVLGTSSGADAKIQAVPLSRDHTPYRPDEAARCVASGARILSFGQIDPASAVADMDDDVEDPPRVWAMNGHYPGTAFTRSLGDAVAERLGVYAEPETVTLPISKNERVLVLASDGVFDVVSNQEAVEICHEYRDDPAKACEEVIEKSHREWLLNDDCDEEDANYDDMTAVVVFFDHPGEGGRAEGGGADVRRGPSSQPERPHRPHTKRVRQKTLENLEAMGG